MIQSFFKNYVYLSKSYDLEKLIWPSDSRESFYLTTLQEHLYTFGVEVKFRRIVGFYLEAVWLWRISGGYSQEMMDVTLRGELVFEVVIA